MGHIHTMSYNKVGRKCQGGGNMRSGFRLSPKRFSVHRLRAKFYLVFRLIARLKSSYGNAFDAVKRNLSRNGNKKDGNATTSSRRNLVMRKDHVTNNMYHYRLKSFGRSNSFYSEAIADCLEFIKRTSVSSTEDEKED